MTTGEVKIKIIGWQTMGEERDTTIVEAEGIYTKTDDGCIIEYIEKPAEDMEVQNIITITRERAVISKRGVVESEMIFVPGEKSSVEYKTPFGIIDMTIKCDTLNFFEGEYECKIKISYSLYSGEQLVANCSTEIDIGLV